MDIQRKRHGLVNFVNLTLYILISLTCVFGAQQVGHCKLSPTKLGEAYGVEGMVLFSYDQSSNQVEVTADITGSFNLTEYAIHVHQFGDLTDKDGGTAAGSHYVGLGSTEHGCPPSTNRHEGDMGNWAVESNAIHQVKTFDLLQLTGNYSIIGRSVILHELADNCTGPTGFAGSRLAQCVIGIANIDINDASNAASSEVNSAVCVFQPSNSDCEDCQGTVWLKQLYEKDIPSGLEITSKVSGLKDSTPHGFHIHDYGDLSAKDGTSAGAHYNPYGRTHNLPSASSRHAGDLGNLQSYDSSNNDAWYYVNNYDYISDLTKIIGRSFVVHETKDHGSGEGCNESGNSGNRYLVCVIGIANSATEIPAVPASVVINTSYQSEPCVKSGSSGDGGDDDDHNHSSSSENGGNKTLIIAVAIGWVLVALLLFIVIVLVVCLVKKRKSAEFLQV